MKKNKVTKLTRHEPLELNKIIEGLGFTKNFRSATAEEWYVFIPGFEDPSLGGAPAKVFIQYDLQGNRDVFINTTIIINNPELHQQEESLLIQQIADELINRLVGYADTLLTVHAGENSYDAEYIKE